MVTDRELLDVAEEGRKALEGIDVGEHTEDVGIAWVALCELCDQLWQRVLAGIPRG